MIQFYMHISSVSMRTVNSLKPGQGLMYFIEPAPCCAHHRGLTGCVVMVIHVGIHLTLSSKVCLIALDKNRIPVFPVSQYEKTRVILVY